MQRAFHARKDNAIEDVSVKLNDLQEEMDKIHSQNQELEILTQDTEMTSASLVDREAQVEAEIVIIERSKKEHSDTIADRYEELARLRTSNQSLEAYSDILDSILMEVSRM